MFDLHFFCLNLQFIPNSVNNGCDKVWQASLFAVLWSIQRFYQFGPWIFTFTPPCNFQPTQTTSKLVMIMPNLYSPCPNLQSILNSVYVGCDNLIFITIDCSLICSNNCSTFDRNTLQPTPITPLNLWLVFSLSIFNLNELHQWELSYMKIIMMLVFPNSEVVQDSFG